MNDIIKIGPENYLAKLKDHVGESAKESLLALKNATDMVIATDDDLRVAKEDFVALRDRLKVLEEDRKEITVPLNAVLDQVNTIFKEPAEAWKQARAILERKAGEYSRKKEAERQEAERKAQEAARKEEERIRKEKEAQEAEWRKKEAERQREAEALAQKAAKERNEAKRAELEAQAEKARQEAAKAQEKANQRAQEAQEAFVPAPTIEKTEVKVAGSKKVTRYFAKVIDPKKVPVEWCGRTLRPVDEGILNEIARGLKSTQSPIEGVQFYAEERLS